MKERKITSHDRDVYQITWLRTSGDLIPGVQSA